jgi:hypothetical protein
MTAIRQRHATTVAGRLLLDIGILRHENLETPSDQIIAEYLRQNLCALATSPGTDNISRPVYVTHLLNRVRAQLRPLWPQLDTSTQHLPSLREQEQEGDKHPDPVRRVLDALHDVRDVADVGDGYWLPGPTRLVALSHSKALVVSGLGTRDVSTLLNTQVRFTWIARTVKRGALPTAIVDDPTWWQPLDHWCGNETRSDLATWTERLIVQARRHAMQSGSSVTEFEVYAPERQRREPQYFRWIPVDDLSKPSSDLMLCRSATRRFSPVRYWFGAVAKHDGAYRLVNEYPVAARDMRRLLYGLDMRADAPTHATVEPRGIGHLLTLRSWLPSEERRLLVALARDVSSIPGCLPLRFELALDHTTQAVDALRALWIDVQTIV